MVRPTGQIARGERRRRALARLRAGWPIEGGVRVLPGNKGGAGDLWTWSPARGEIDWRGFRR